MKVWGEVQPAGGDFTFEPGQRYAILASVSKNYSLAEIMAKATSEGFSITYAWEQGQPSRGLYPIDDWLAGLLPDATSNHRWVWGEGNFQATCDSSGECTPIAGAKSWTLGVDPPWPLSIYHLQHVFQAVEQAQSASEAPALPAEAQCPPAPAGVSTTGAVLWTLGGVVVGAVVGTLVGPRLVAVAVG